MVHWQINDKTGALFGFAFYLNFSPMRFHNAPTDRQSQPAAASTAVAALFPAVKPFKNMRQVRSRDAFSGITNSGFVNITGSCSRKYFTLPPAGVCRMALLIKIGKYTPHLLHIHRYQTDIIRQCTLQRYPFLFSQFGKTFDGIRN